ncbi:hypothetical protein NDU88_004444 [Pleurodeles waltl]|uniref:Uncharacterized protein n=1 Tax=Pleurodeles waltl TaxID=8319 RepID=A0AAV7NJP6_PLEWA|nr:hypothetical protein NDU88_004444 [Pleurodeles waltl]
MVSDSKCCYCLPYGQVRTWRTVDTWVQIERVDSEVGPPTPTARNPDPARRTPPAALRPVQADHLVLLPSVRPTPARTSRHNPPQQVCRLPSSLGLWPQSPIRPVAHNVGQPVPEARGPRPQQPHQEAAALPAPPPVSRCHHRATGPNDLQRVRPRGAPQPAESHRVQPRQGLSTEAAGVAGEPRADPTADPAPAKSLLQKGSRSPHGPQPAGPHKTGGPTNFKKPGPMGPHNPPIHTPPSSALGAWGQQAKGVAGGPPPHPTADRAPAKLPPHSKRRCRIGSDALRSWRSNPAGWTATSLPRPFN